MDTNIFIDVTSLQAQERHPAIFAAFDQIPDGGKVTIHNDHDPRPVYYQLLGLKGNCFSWTYTRNGPDTWEVEIIKSEPTTNETIGQIVSRDIRKAEVFKRFGLDFCCGGKKTVEAACREKGIDATDVQTALSKIEDFPSRQPEFNNWKLSSLVDYIINEHHQYVNNNTQLIRELADKVAGKHGEQQPSVKEINDKLSTLLGELTTHMRKEEAVLFPYIKTMEQLGGPVNIGFASVQDPIWVMESDHDLAGELMRDIRELSNSYTPPENACNSQKLLYYKLGEFEDSLFQHVHLENNILFPRALALERGN